MIYFTFDPRPDLKEDLLQSLPQETFVFDTTISEGKLAEAEIVVTYGEDLNDSHMSKMPNVKWIFVTSAGIEKMPLQHLQKTDILVSNVRGIHKVPMAESVMAHILGQYRSLPTIYIEEQQHQWNRKMKSRELRDSTAVILGPGAIGGEIGRLLQAFGVKTIGCNRSGKQADYMDQMTTFDDLIHVLPAADLVISVLPSTDETKYLLTSEHFKMMKNDAMFLNFGRGSLVETSVLVEALQNNEIGFAVCDVFEEEPLPKDSPLWDLKNMTVSPHVSSHSTRYLERSFDIFKRNIGYYRAGELDKVENKVDLQAGY
ncbi:MAG: D-2-hydroxyacid dehydrogenase [Kurthia sp.]|nr:D-2-hydroxyacid dehydrogenase [Candidatus Kurthia equi]